MEKNSKILVAGCTGMVGTAIVTALLNSGYTNVVGASRSPERDNELFSEYIKVGSYSTCTVNFCIQADVENLFNNLNPEYIFLAAARVGGILANSTAKANFFYENAMIAQNIIHNAWVYKVKKLVNLGSSCIYPKMALQPLKEEYLLTGPLEPTNDAYALAKIGAIKMCTFYNEQYGTNFMSVMPTNLYGFNDNFDLKTSHVLPAMIRKFHEAKQNNTEVTLWGDGSPMREFLHASDLADAVIYLMLNKNFSEVGDFVNVGTGTDLTIKSLSELIAGIVGFTGKVNWDTSKPNGTPRKLMDVSKMTELGWNYSIELEDGIAKVYSHYCKKMGNVS